jgi:hypothetical protein
MTEAEWNGCTDPTPMLEWLGNGSVATDRKFRLLAFACCFRIWHLLPDEGKQVALAAESYAEGRAARHERDAAVAAFRRMHGRYSISSPLLRAAYHTKEVSFDAWTVGLVAVDAAWAADGFSSAPGYALHDEFARSPTLAAERAAQASLIREIFGPLPFRGIGIDPDWLAWTGGTVRQLAESAYEKRSVPGEPLDGGRFGVVADALEDAGCNDPELLEHLRGAGAHVRGCWVIDLLLGKS